MFLKKGLLRRNLGGLGSAQQRQEIAQQVGHLGARKTDLLRPEPFPNLIQGGMLPKPPITGLNDHITTETSSRQNQALCGPRSMHFCHLSAVRVRTLIALLKNVEPSREGHHLFAPDIPTPAQPLATARTMTDFRAEIPFSSGTLILSPAAHGASPQG